MNPGDRLTRSSQYAQLLNPRANNGTHLGGLADVGQRLLMTALMKKDMADQSAATRAFAQGAGARPWVDPDTGEVAPGQPETGGFEGAISALGGLRDNPYAGRLASQLMAQRLSAPSAEGFTLSPGQTRYGPGGQPIATSEPKPAAMPSLVEEYNFAKQNGFGGSYLDYVKAKGEATRSQTNIDARTMGTIPPGYQLVESPGGRRMEPIPGSPAATEQAAAEQARAEKTTQTQRYADVVVQDIDRVLNIADKSKIPVTGAGSYLSGIPGTSARDVAGLLDTIRANIGFDRLQQMRDASPTGGALGQVSEFENRLLQATLGNLEQSQSEEQFRQNLGRLRDLYLDIIHGPGNRPEAPAMNDNPPAAGGQWSIQKVE